MKKGFTAVALIIAAVLLCACGVTNEPQPTPSPTPDPFTLLQQKIAQYAPDAQVSEAENALLITLPASGADEAAQCDTFFTQAEDICKYCLNSVSYGTVSFNLSADGKPVASFYVLIDESGFIPLPPTAYNDSYEQPLESAFYASAFVYGVEG